MLIIDSHLDLAWNALQWNRNLLYSTYTLRTQESATEGKGRAQGTVALPDMRRGRLALSFTTVMARSTGRPVAHIDYASPTQSYGGAQGHLAYYRALQYAGHVRLIGDVASLNSHIAEWESWDAAQAALSEETPPLGFVISMESADPILDPAQLPEWWAAGLRVIGPAHYGPGRYAGGTGTEMGLSDIGLALLAEMERVGMILDLTHLSDQAFWQAVQRFNGPVLASHNNCRVLVPHQRQFSDEQLKVIIDRQGVIGAAFDCWMLQPGWITGHTSNEKVTLATVVDHIDHVCQLAGSSHHAAIGTDLDGGYGREQSPCDLDTIADLQNIPALLAGHGYSQDDIANIMYKNWLRLLRQSWN